MAKKLSRKDTEANLFTVFVTAYGEGAAQDAARIAIAAAGGTLDTVKRDYQAGRMASLLAKGQEPTEGLRQRMFKVLSNAGFKGTAKLKEGQGRRSAAEEQAYSSARTAWTRITAKAGVKDKNGAARKAAAEKGANKRKEEAASKVDAIVEAPKAPAIPRAKDNAECVTFLHQQAAMLLAFANKNAKAMPIEARNAVGAFMAAIKVLAPQAD